MDCPFLIHSFLWTFELVILKELYLLCDSIEYGFGFNAKSSFNCNVEEVDCSFEVVKNFKFPYSFLLDFFCFYFEIFFSYIRLPGSEYKMCQMKLGFITS